MLLTSILKSFLVYLYYLKKVFYNQDSLISKPCELENINFQLIDRADDHNQLYQNFPLFIARPEYSFQHGVASGDPSSYSSIFWTRVTPKFKVAKSSLIPVHFQLALDECFHEKVISAVTYTNSLIDFTIKLHVRNLSPNTIYYFKFNDERGSTNSIVGKSKTLPSPGFTESINLDITDSNDYIGNDLSDFIFQLSDYKNKFFTRLKDYRYRYSKEPRSSNITTLYGSNPNMFTKQFILNDYTQALLEWFPIKPPKRHLPGKFFEFGEVLKISVVDHISSNHSTALDLVQIAHSELICSTKSPHSLEFHSSNGLNNSIVDIRDYKGILPVRISPNGVFF